MAAILKKPSAWVPIALSGVMLSIMIGYFIFAGPLVSEPDEGIAAHLFQIWLPLEMLLIGFFAATALPHTPKQALTVLALQIIAVLVVCFPVFYFQL